MTGESLPAPLHLGCSWAEAGLGPGELTAARAAVAPLAERLALRAALAPYAPQAWSEEAASAPTLYLEDISEIPFLVNILGVEEYQHRSRVRAGSGDLFAAVTPPTPGYADYCREVLELGDPELLLPEPVGGPMEVARACGAGPTLRRVVEVARAAGRLGLHPYMGIEPVWELARRVSHDAGVPVRVCAPPPPVTWIANDKSLLSEVVERVLGPALVVETHRSACPSELSRRLFSLCGRHARAGLKRTRCASGMGNIHFALADLTDLAACEARVRAFLQGTEWDGREEVLVVAWEDTPTSPSTQLWIPPLAAGPPRLDGIYEQLLEGAERVFLGSRPSQLPAAANRALAAASLQVAAGLQALGYVGRCSFDLLLLGAPEGEFQLRFTECNGRWGGTSTPMHLVDRLVRGPRPPYRAQDLQRDALVGATLDDVLRAVGDELYRPGRGGRFAFYNVNPLTPSGKLDVIAFGRCQAEAEDALLEDLPRLLGVA
ncbi:MAG: hypothetical protein AB7N76_34990 [Planctomycetota bacterium]